MKRTFVSLLALTVILGIANAGIITTYVQPEGDGQNGKDRWGWGSWYVAGFNSGANPNWSGHWYESPDGQWRDVYMQVSLAAIPSDADIQAASLNIYVTACSNKGSRIFHKSDASAATGLASQQIAGDQYIQDLVGLPVGWYSIDVKDFIISDVNNGYAWAVFSFPNYGYSSLSFYSADDATYKPYLSVTTAAVEVPEPASIGLILTGLGFVIRKRA